MMAAQQNTLAPPAFVKQDGWQGKLTLDFKRSAERTVLAHRRRIGPLAVQRAFYPEGDACHIYLLHPPGGVVGGDRLEVDVSSRSGAHALLTTPGAAKFYRSSGAWAEQRQTLLVENDAVLEWMPQENIAFPGAHARLATRVDLYGNARIVLWEIHCLGRPSNEEAFEHGRFDAALSIYRDDKPLLLDRLRVAPDTRRRRALMAGESVNGTLVLSGADADALERARELLQIGDGHRTGATLIDDLLIVRYLGGSTEQARKAFEQVWAALRDTTLGRPPCRPRIWDT
jgi:urease accessory protein